MKGCMRNDGGNCVAKIGEVCCSRAPGRIAPPHFATWHGWGTARYAKPLKYPVIGCRIAEECQFELPNGGYRDALHLATDDVGACS